MPLLEPQFGAHQVFAIDNGLAVVIDRVVALSRISDGETFPGQIITAQHHQDMQPLAEFAIFSGPSVQCADPRQVIVLLALCCISGVKPDGRPGPRLAANEPGAALSSSGWSTLFTAGFGERDAFFLGIANRLHGFSIFAGLGSGRR